MTETEKLNVEQRRYHNYTVAKLNWERKRAQIIGSKDQPDTLKFYEEEIDYLDEKLDKILESKYEERRNIVRSIFDKNRKLLMSTKIPETG